MMKRLIFTLLFSIAGLYLIAQNSSVYDWARTYGGSQGDVANALVATDDGGYAVVGYTNSKGEGRSDLWLMKLDANGVIVWEKTFGGKRYDVGKSIIKTADGGFVITGETKSKGAGQLDMWVMKVNKSGELLWDKTLGGKGFDFAASFVSVSKAADAGYVVLGHKIDPPKHKNDTTDYDVWLLKMDESGNILWERTYGKDFHDFASSVMTTPEGNYIIAGNTKEADGLFKFWLLHLDSKGMLIDERILPEGDIANTLTNGPDGGYIVSGNTETGNGESNIWVMLMDKSLNIVWNKVVNAKFFDYANSVTTTFDGGIVVAGFSRLLKGEDNHNWRIIKFNRIGDVVWEKTFGGDNDDRPNMIIQSDKDAFVTAGLTKSEGSGQDDFHIIKFRGYLFDLEKTLTEGGIDTLDYLLKPKGEYEEAKAYVARIEAYENQKLVVIKAEEERFEAIQEQKIVDSYEHVTATIDELSYYNADKEAYRVLVADQWYELPMKISEAQEFKGQWQNAKVKGLQRLSKNLVTKEMINLGFLHPVSNNPYAIGMQVSDNSLKRFIEIHKADTVPPTVLELKGTGKNVIGFPYMKPEGAEDARWFAELEEFKKLGVDDCMKGKMAEHKDKIKAKGEFEKTADCKKRSEEYNKIREKALMECKTEKEFADQEKIKNSYKFETFKINEISAYNPDKKEYMILVNKKWYAVPMTKDEAMSFRDSWQNVDVKGVSRLNPDNITEKEVINMQVVLTSGGKVIPIGKQVSPKDDKFLNDFVKNNAQ